MEGGIQTDLPATPAPVALDVLVVLLLFAAVVLLVAAVRLLRTRLRARREENRELPPLVYPLRQVAEQQAASAAGRPRQPAAGPERAPVGEQVLYNSTAPVAPPVHIVHEESASDRDVVAGNGHANGSHADDTDDDVTLQLLPGRLEPVERGMDQEIRFVRVPGVNRFTLGRNAGPAHSHIQLHAATASRMHACMVFDEGRWQLGNMSQTNAVVVNGAPLNGDPRQLEDGDRIEFGELTFVFRER